MLETSAKKPVRNKNDRLESYLLEALERCDEMRDSIANPDEHPAFFEFRDIFELTNVALSSMFGDELDSTIKRDGFSLISHRTSYDYCRRLILLRQECNMPIPSIVTMAMNEKKVWMEGANNQEACQELFMRIDDNVDFDHTRRKRGVFVEGPFGFYRFLRNMLENPWEDHLYWPSLYARPTVLFMETEEIKGRTQKNLLIRKAKFNTLEEEKWWLHRMLYLLRSYRFAGDRFFALLEDGATPMGTEAEAQIGHNLRPQIVLWQTFLKKCRTQPSALINPNRAPITPPDPNTPGFF